MKLDLGVVDEQDGRVYLRVHKLAIDVDGREPPAGYQLLLPRDTFEHPPVEIDGVMVRTASPLAEHTLLRRSASCTTLVCYAGVV